MRAAVMWSVFYWFVLFSLSREGLAGAPSWTLKDTQSLNGSIFRVVCSGIGPSIGFARHDALDSCKVSAVQQLTTDMTIKSMSVTSESQAAYQQEVVNQSRVSGLSCVPRREETLESGAEVRLWLLCEFDLSKARILPGPALGDDRRPESAVAPLSDSRKVLTLAVIPGCEDLIIRGGGPARAARCGRNPVSVLLDPEDREIILRAKDHLPKTIYLGPQRAERGYVQIVLEPNP